MRQPSPSSCPASLCPACNIHEKSLALYTAFWFALKVFPGREETSYKLPFTKVVYIESTDFRETDEKGYFGLAPGKAVMLR